MFDLDGPLMDALRKLSDIVFYNILFCLFSLPIVTTGAALAALCEGMQLIAEGKDTDLQVFKTFFGCFRRSFKRATELWFLSMLGTVILASLSYAAASFSGRPLGTSYSLIYYIAAILFLVGYHNLYPTLARWPQLSVKACLIRTYMVAVIGLPWTLLGIMVTVAFSFVTLVLNHNIFRFGFFLWAVCGFGILTYICSFFFLRAVSVYERKMALQGTADREGDQ